MEQDIGALVGGAAIIGAALPLAYLGGRKAVGAIKEAITERTYARNRLWTSYEAGELSERPNLINAYRLEAERVLRRADRSHGL